MKNVLAMDFDPENLPPYLGALHHRGDVLERFAAASTDPNRLTYGQELNLVEWLNYKTNKEHKDYNVLVEHGKNVFTSLMQQCAEELGVPESALANMGERLAHTTVFRFDSIAELENPKTDGMTLLTGLDSAVILIKYFNDYDTLVHEFGHVMEGRPTEGELDNKPTGLKRVFGSGELGRIMQEAATEDLKTALVRKSTQPKMFERPAGQYKPERRFLEVLCTSGALPIDRKLVTQAYHLDDGPEFEAVKEQLLAQLAAAYEGATPEGIEQKIQAKVEEIRESKDPKHTIDPEFAALEAYTSEIAAIRSTKGPLKIAA